MPIYEYRCDKCGRRFEELVLTASDEVECPHCGCGKVERLISPFSSSKGGCAPSGGFG